MIRLTCIPVLTLALAVSGPARLSAAEPPWAAVVGTYPQPGTPEALQDLGVVVWLQHARTQADVARAVAERHPSIGCFVNVLDHRTLDMASYPLTEALLAQARADLEPIVEGLKATFARPRPYAVFPSLTPVVPLEASASYPSAHAAVGVLYARILAQFDPGGAAALMERGGQLGDDRVLAGVHWPSDTEAGQRLGRAFATWWISQPEHRQQIVDVCAREWHGR